MSLPHKTAEGIDTVVGEGVSSPDNNGDTKTSTEIYNTARRLEEKEVSKKLIGNPSDADISNSSDSALIIGAERSVNVRGSSEGTSIKLQRSPKKVHKRTKLDTKIPGEGDGDSSDEVESKTFKRSPKKLKCDVKEEMVDNVAELSSGMSQTPDVTLKRERLDYNIVDTKDNPDNEKSKPDNTDNKSISSKPFQSSSVKSDMDDNASDVPVTTSVLKKSPVKFMRSKSEPPEVLTTMAEEKIDGTAEAGFEHVKASLLIAAAVSNIIHKEEMIPPPRISNKDSETTTEIGSETCFEEKERTYTDKFASLEVASELIAADFNIFGKVEDIENLSEQSTDNTQNVDDLVAAEYGGDSNTSLERMEFGSECNTIDHGIGTGTDVEKMDCSSESWTGFESIKTGSESNTTLEKMECKSESSVSREEMETESASVKSAEIEGMEYSSESVLAESESISYQENDSISNEGKDIGEYSIDESSKPVNEPSVPYIFENVPDAASKPPENEQLIPHIFENVPDVASKPEKESIPHIFENVPDVASKPEKEQPIPHIFENVPDVSTKTDKEQPIFENESHDILETKRELSIPRITVENEPFISNESESNSNEVRLINESSTLEVSDINRTFSIPRFEASDDATNEYEFDQNKGSDKDKDSIVASTSLAPDNKRPVIEIVKEPSNTDHGQSSKLQKSTDIHKQAEGGNISNVSESADTQKVSEAPCVGFTDTDSDEFKDCKDTDYEGSPKKFKKRK